MHKTKITKLLCLVLSLMMILGAAPISALAADELSETLIFMGDDRSSAGTHFVATPHETPMNKFDGLILSSISPATITARKDEIITKIVLPYGYWEDYSSITVEPAGTFDGFDTFYDINAKEITLTASGSPFFIERMTVYYEGDATNPTVSVTGGANTTLSGGWTTQQYLPGAMDTLIYTAYPGCYFEDFEPYTKNGITVAKTGATEVTVSGTPTEDTQITVPDAVTKGSVVTYSWSDIASILTACYNDGSYSDEDAGLTFSASGLNRPDEFELPDESTWFTFTAPEAKISYIRLFGDYTWGYLWSDYIFGDDDGSFTVLPEDGLIWNGTPSESVTLRGLFDIDGLRQMLIITVPAHTHTFTEAWSSDANGHWHECTEDGCDIEDYAECGLEGAAYGEHTVVNGVCSVCERVFTVYTAEDNVLTATVGATPYTLTIKDDGTISAEDISAWEAAGLTVPEIVLDAATNTASITAEEATATVALAEGTLKTHSVKVICGADENGKSYITDVLAGTDVTVTAGTYEGKLFEKWISDLSIDGSTDETVTFRMPNEDVTVEAEFVDCYALSVFDGTTLTSEPQKVNYSATVTVPATPDGMRFTGWTAEGITLTDPMASELEFVMPENAVMLTANFAELYTVTVTDGKITDAGTTCQAIAGETISVTADTISGHNFTGWTAEGVEFADAASATTTFTMPASDVSVTANHEQVKAAIPTAGTDTYTYNGKKQTYVFANEGDKNYYSLTNNVQTDAGTYTVKAHLVDGAAWTDGTTADKEFTFVIERQPINKPVAYNTQYYYTGAAQKLVLCTQIDGNDYYYETVVPAGSVSFTNNIRTDAGTQTVTATPAANYCWADGTTDTLSFEFTINRYPIPTLNDDTRTFTFNGSAQTYTPFVKMSDGIHDFDGYFYNLSNRTQTDRGTYTVTANLNDNFCWNNGSTAPKNFSFKIASKKLDSFIYYVNDLKTGENEVCVDMSYTLFDNTKTLSGFGKHPAFKEEMLKDHYQPCLKNVPAGADVEFYLKETPGTPKTLSEAFTYTSWDYVKMSDLKPNTIYYMFALVTHPDYDLTQITEVNNMSRFITSDPQYTLQTTKNIKKTEADSNYLFNCAMAVYSGGINDVLGAFGTKPSSKTVNVTAKAAYYTIFEEAIAQGIKDIEEGLDSVLVSWFDSKGVMQSYTITKDNLSNFKTALASITIKSAAKKMMLAAPAGDPAPVAITGISGEVPELTPELLCSMFNSEELALLPLDNMEFRVEKDFETETAQIKDKNEEMLERLAAAGILPVEGEPDEYTSTVTINSYLYDFKSEAVDGGTDVYELKAGDLLPADAIKEIDGYTFIGLYYAEIMKFEQDNKPAEATGDHGMILTQGLVKWYPETDYVTRDLDLMALYVKDGAEEPVGYKADGTTFLDEGSEAIVTLPALMDGMTYGDVINDNADINVSAITDGKLTVTLANDVTGEEPFTFTVEVNANIEGIEDPFYYIIVTIDAVEAADVKEDTEAAIEALAGDDASDEVKSIIADAVAALADANSIEAVNEIFAKAEAAVALQKAKEDSKTAIEALAGDDASDEVKAIVEKALTDIEAAEDIAAVEAIAAAAETDVAEQKAAEALAEAKEEAKAAIDAAIEADDSDDVKAAAEEAKTAIDNATTLEEVEDAKTSALEKMEDVRGRCPYCGEKGHKNWIDKLFCFIKRIVKLIEMFFGFADDVKAL